MKKRRFFCLPLLERLFKTKASFTFVREKIIEVDGIGVIVHCEKEEEIDVEKIRKWIKLKIRTRTFCVIQANSPKDSIKRFYKIYEQARIGKRSKALVIDGRRNITELPYCEFLYQGTKEKRFVCGPPKKGIDYDSGLFGMCILDGADAPNGECSLREADLKCFNSYGGFARKKTKEIFVGGKRFYFLPFFIV